MYVSLSRSLLGDPSPSPHFAVSESAPAPITTGRAFFERKYGRPDGTEVQQLIARRAWMSPLPPPAPGAPTAGSMSAETFRTLVLDVSRSALGERVGVVEALAIGEEDTQDPERYAAWLTANYMQLMGTGVPQRLCARCSASCETRCVYTCLRSVVIVVLRCVVLCCVVLWCGVVCCVLCCVVLCCVVLCCVVLCCVVLCCVVLCCVVLCCVVLCCVVLCCVVLCCVVLCCVVLCCGSSGVVLLDRCVGV